MSVKLLTEHHLEFLSLTGDCTGLSESTLVKMPHCWKSRVAALIVCCIYSDALQNNHIMDINTMNPDQTAPWLWFKLFAMRATKIHNRQQFNLEWGKRIIRHIWKGPLIAFFSIHSILKILLAKPILWPLTETI